jgi:hypothetical protein
MIKIVHLIARYLAPLKWLWLLSIFIMLVWCAYIVLSNRNDLAPYLLPCLTLLTWFICLYSISASFNNSPLEITSDDGFFTRIKKRTKIGFTWLFALTFILCSLALVYLIYVSLKFLLQ